MTVLRMIASYSVIGVACAMFAQQSTHEPDSSRRVVTTTRLVAVFSDLEKQWLQAVQRKDEAALTGLLGEDFEVWTPQNNGPITREQWLKQNLAQELQAFRFRQMAARSLSDDKVVTNFVLSESVQSGIKTAVQNYFVVDIWSKTGERWVCTDRYVSSLSKATAPAADVKPSGKQ